MYPQESFKVPCHLALSRNHEVIDKARKPLQIAGSYMHLRLSCLLLVHLRFKVNSEMLWDIPYFRVSLDSSLEIWNFIIEINLKIRNFQN